MQWDAELKCRIMEYAMLGGVLETHQKMPAAG